MKHPSTQQQHVYQLALFYVSGGHSLTGRKRNPTALQLASLPRREIYKVEKYASTG
jgi:hypothetical protein